MSDYTLEREPGSQYQFSTLGTRLLALGAVRKAQCGAVSFIQRFGSALDLNVHVHAIMLDGVYAAGEAQARQRAASKDDEQQPQFQVVPAPDEEEIARVTASLAKRISVVSLRSRPAASPCCGPPESLSSPGSLKRKRARSTKPSSRTSCTTGPLEFSKLAMTLDGKIATRSGESKWITSEESRNLVQQFRRQVDAIVTGSGTVLRDNSRLSVRVCRAAGRFYP